MWQRTPLFIQPHNPYVHRHNSTQGPKIDKFSLFNSVHFINIKSISHIGLEGSWRGHLVLPFVWGYFLMKPFQFEERLSYPRAPRTTLVGQTLLGDRSFPCNFHKAHVLHLNSTVSCAFVLKSKETEMLAYHHRLCTCISPNQFSAFSSSDWPSPFFQPPALPILCEWIFFSKPLIVVFCSPVKLLQVSQSPIQLRPW